MKDQDATEFFFKGMFQWFFGSELLAEEFIYVSLMSAYVNELYKLEIASKMN